MYYTTNQINPVFAGLALLYLHRMCLEGGVQAFLPPALRQAVAVAVLPFVPHSLPRSCCLVGSLHYGGWLGFRHT